MADLYFNGRDWRAIGLSEQQVRFLEELLARVGGSQQPDQTLTEVVNSVTNIGDVVTTANEQINILKRRLSEKETEVQMMLTHIKRLEHRVNQLEDAQ